MTWFPSCVIIMRGIRTRATINKFQLVQSSRDILLQGPLLLTRISNHMRRKVRDENTYPFPNFNGYTAEVWEWISNFIPHIMIDFSMLWLELIHACKRGPRCMTRIVFDIFDFLSSWHINQIFTNMYVYYYTKHVAQKWQIIKEIMSRTISNYIKHCFFLFGQNHNSKVGSRSGTPCYLRKCYGIAANVAYDNRHVCDIRITTWLHHDL